MDKDYITTLKQQFVAAMSVEMKNPLQKILGASSELKDRSPEKAGEIQEAARYLLSLVEELSQLSQVKP